MFTEILCSQAWGISSLKIESLENVSHLLKPQVKFTMPCKYREATGKIYTTSTRVELGAAINDRAKQPRENQTEAPVRKRNISYVLKKIGDLIGSNPIEFENASLHSKKKNS